MNYNPNKDKSENWKDTKYWIVQNFIQSQFTKVKRSSIIIDKNLNEV